MPASSTRVAVATVAAVSLGLAGLFAWRHIAQAPDSGALLVTSALVQPRGDAAPSQPSASRTTAPAKPSESAKIGVPSDAAANEAAAAAGTDKGAERVPTFDVVRVEPSGDALLAGRSKPNETVAVMAGGKVVAETKADAGGNFVLTPSPLEPGNYALSLREGQGATAKDSKQSVVISVPASKAQPVVVAMSEPGKATTILSVPPTTEASPRSEPTPAAITPGTTAAPPAPTAAPKLAIASVELENGSGLFASGTAPPGTDVRIYLNDSRVADVIAAAAGRWTVTVRKGLSAGRYQVRADSLKPDRTVDARVEVPFDVPAPMTTGQAEAPAAGVQGADVGAGSAKPSPADVVVAELKTELVARGDNLWRISRKRLGYGTRYTEIYAANAAQIRDPKLVYPGQVFVLPHE